MGGRTNWYVQMMMMMGWSGLVWSGLVWAGLVWPQDAPKRQKRLQEKTPPRKKVSQVRGPNSNQNRSKLEPKSIQSQTKQTLREGARTKLRLGFLEISGEIGTSNMIYFCPVWEASRGALEASQMRLEAAWGRLGASCKSLEWTAGVRKGCNHCGIWNTINRNGRFPYTS